MDYYPYGKTLRSYIPTTPTERYQSTHNERDSETNYDHREARNSDSGWGRFLGVDALAGDYPAISPYCYVGGNPVRMVDRDGKEIVNPYEDNKQYAGLEQQLKDNIAKAQSRKEKKIARKELRANMDKIEGYNNYKEVDGLISDFKKAKEAEYNRVDNLQLNGVEINVIVSLNGGDGSVGQVGDTNYAYRAERGDITVVTDFQTKDSYYLPNVIRDNQIGVTLYARGRTLGTLANEFGDAIFAVENPVESYRDANSNLSYHELSATKFSFAYEKYIIKGGEKPNPLNY